MPGRRPKPSGMTLVELLVVIAVISTLIALILPAVSAAREAARRAQCSSNLRQLGIGLLHYQDVEGAFPLGQMLVYDQRYLNPSKPCAPWRQDKSFLVSALPYLEQQSLFNAYNQVFTVYSPDHATVRSAIVGIFSCPSDPESGRLRKGHPLSRLYPHDEIDTMPAEQVASCSYAGCQSIGVLTALPEPVHCQVEPWRARTANGCLTDLGPVTLASITDGTSNTMLLVEKSTTTLLPLRERVGYSGIDRFDESGWWFAGSLGDTLITAFYPPNAHRQSTFRDHFAWRWSASSLHPGGLNVSMADGSVRFVKETIESKTATPFDLVGQGVWQKLGTRNGQELVAEGF